MTQVYLNHFINAHKASYCIALAELELGLKTTHWMWFIFPRAAGLGRSDLAKFYSIEKLSEAKAFATHEYLGKNYSNCLQTLLSHRHTPIDDILGQIDARVPSFPRCQISKGFLTNVISRRIIARSAARLPKQRNIIVRHVGAPVVVRLPDSHTERVLPGDAHLERGRRGQAL